MNINLKGVWWGCKYAIEQFKKQDKDKAKKSGGSIINTASFVGLVGSATPCVACKFRNYTGHMIVFTPFSIPFFHV